MVGVLSNKIVRDELKPGDHIYSWRHCYLCSHHGIYVGNGKVIHFTPGNRQKNGKGTVSFFRSSPSNPPGSPCPRCGDQSKFDGVILSCLECFLSGGKLYRYQYGVRRVLFLVTRAGTCSVRISDPPEDVLYRAEYLLKNGFFSYNIYKNNCEDFAIYCKTSLLVPSPVITGLSGQITSSVVTLLLPVGYRPDVKKVPVESLSCPGVDEPEPAKETSEEDSDIEYEPWGQII